MFTPYLKILNGKTVVVLAFLPLFDEVPVQKTHLLLCPETPEPPLAHPLIMKSLLNTC